MSVARRILVVGASTSFVCGVRDFARAVAEVSEDDVHTVWWDMGARSRTPGRLRVDAQGWLDQVREAVTTVAPDAILWHYSVFTYGWHGMPVLQRPVARALARMGPPVVVMLHELCFPFARSWLKGNLWALSQRTALVPVVGRARGSLVTTPERQAWVGSRWWLPRRPVSFTPVCSTVKPMVCHRAIPYSGRLEVGVFGFWPHRHVADEVAGAIRLLRDRGSDARLTLIGAPGPAGDAARIWRRAIDAVGCGDALRFTGIVERPALARALADVDVLLFADIAGPAARNTRLAAALATGRPIVATSGPEQWPQLIEEEAVTLVTIDDSAIASALARMATTPDEAALQAARASDFHAREMAPTVVSRRISAAIRLAIESDDA